MDYPRAAVERAMKVQEVILRAIGKRITWWQAAEILGISVRSMRRWRWRYQNYGYDGLYDHRRGLEAFRQLQKRQRSRRILTPELEQTILDTTLKTRPPDATHWSVRELARQLGVSRMMVHRVWQRYDVQPHRVEKFKLSNDPEFEEKVRNVVGLYLNPPDRALVLFVDEKSQIQALDRTAPLLPLRPGLPERQRHDYQRHGTTRCLQPSTSRTEKSSAVACHAIGGRSSSSCSTNWKRKCLRIWRFTSS